LVDSGANRSVLPYTMAIEHGIPFHTSNHPVHVKYGDGGASTVTAEGMIGHKPILIDRIANDCLLAVKDLSDGNNQV